MPGYDYSLPGYYFVTINVHNRVSAFGKIENGKMILNEYGEIVKRQWLWLGERYGYISPGEFIVMPDHFHGIVGIGRPVGQVATCPYWATCPYRALQKSNRYMKSLAHSKPRHRNIYISRGVQSSGGRDRFTTG